MQFYFFHLMPWPHLPTYFNDPYASAWVWLPNSLYDPVKGHELYQSYTDTLAYADELGFDGICVNEHHQNAYGLMPSPNVIGGALTQRTTRCKIAVIGNALPLYNPPLRVAEELAMLDVMSNGRLIAGMVIGGGPEEFSYGVNPTHARQRFREALALIVKNRGSFLYEQKTWDDVEQGVFGIVGSPATVRQKLEHYLKELGVGVVLTGCQTGTLPHELARKSMELLAREVMPHFREQGSGGRGQGAARAGGAA